MSFDIYLQAFRDGDACEGDGDAALALLRPFIASRDKDFVRLATQDGEADVYGVDDPGNGLTFNHVSGRAAWDLIYAVARSAGFVVMPVDCGSLLPDESFTMHLPDGIPEPIVTVGSGEEILAAVEMAK